MQTSPSRRLFAPQWDSTLTCLVSLLALLVHSAVPAHCADRPNIVWLISEDNSVHYLKMFNPHGTETPRIAALAEHGLQFNHAFSNAPVCSVARTTLMTSCYGPRIGTQYHRRAVSVPMPEGLKMFPAYLREAGYYTANNQKKDYNADETPGTWDKSSSTASWRECPDGKPFFYMQSFTTTHESSLHFTSQAYQNQPTSTDPQSVFVAPYHPDTELFRYTVAKYHDNIRLMDSQIGEVVDQLNEDGLLEETFIFYFGDHGGVLPRGKGYAYESGLHVPLIVYVPQKFASLSPFPSGTKVDSFVQFIDFGATVLKLAGLEIPRQVDGRPFLGAGVKETLINGWEESLGYADRFDEKYDLVRTLRAGKFEYVRSYQPFNYDGLWNNYRYNMMAYREWQELFRNGKLNESQSQFFRPRPAEMLFDIESDPYEVNNLAADPQFSSVLFQLRQRLQQKVKSLPDLSFYPESFLAEHAFGNPVKFGQEHRGQISNLIDIADLSLLPFVSAKNGIAKALDSTDANERYWGLIVCSCFGNQAGSFTESAKKLSKSDPDLLVRTRAAEFLGLNGIENPQPTILDCLSKTQSGIEANLILNSVVLLRDGDSRYDFAIAPDIISPPALQFDGVIRRLQYLNPSAEIDNSKTGKKNKEKNKNKKGGR